MIANVQEFSLLFGLEHGETDRVLIHLGSRNKDEFSDVVFLSWAPQPIQSIFMVEELVDPRKKIFGESIWR